MHRIQVNEVGPRDGFQSREEFIPTEVKIKIIDRLLDCNFDKIEITSFVSPKKVRQMSDAEEIVMTLSGKAAEKGVILRALVPNLQGAARAVASGINDIVTIMSVSETHNMKNTSYTVSQSLKQLDEIRNKFPDIKLAASLATSFGCAFEGRIDPKDVISLCHSVYYIGVDYLNLADTVGMADPNQMEELVKRFQDAFPDKVLSLHLHNTAGMGLASALTAIKLGVYDFDTSIGGMGGCPFSPGATGNMPTEDFLFMVNKMNMQCNVDMQNLSEAVKLVFRELGSSVSSHMSKVYSREL